jgi:hypothetical protein
MGDIYAATDGTAGGNGSQSAPYDLDSALAAAASGDRVILLPGDYGQSADVTTAGVTVEGHFTGVARLVGSVALTGTWELHSGSIWKLTTSAPIALILRTHSDLWLKGEKMDALGEVTADRYWYHTGGVLYLYSSEGDPSVAYWRVDKVSIEGTASSFYAPAKGGLYVQGNDITLVNLGVRGFAVNGHMMDTGDGHTITGCDFSYNAEDGGGGFGMPDCTLTDSRCDWNGTRRPRLGELGATDGDGFSTHDDASIASTNHLIRDCTFEGNCKDAVQNIGGATGVVERCSITNCGFGLVLSTTGAQNFRNIVLRAGQFGLNAFGLIAGNGNIDNCTFIGRDLAASTALVSVFGVGQLVIRNSIITRWPTAAGMSTSSFSHSYNCFDVTTLGLTLGTGEVQADPLLVGDRYQLGAGSPCIGTGTDLSATFEDDRYRRGRPSADWSMGAVEVVDITPRGRALEALCVALERIGDTSGPWQTPSRVRRVVRYGRNAEGVEAPFIELTGVSETYTRASVTGMYARVLRVEFIYVGADWQGYDYLGHVSHDVELAVAQSRTLGGVVDDATLVSNLSRVDGLDNAVSFAIDLRYRTQDNAPLTRI